ncbi:exodeoxyribonuclease VII small subunit [Swaminathania salitolerans]|nr:exodeoxyribonuclease VII small subunit [Swaminathania salitolerans]
MDAQLSKLSFEDALAELDRIVRGLESGQMKLEDAISAYERGAALRRHCETKLSEAEMRVRAITQRDGTVDVAPLSEFDEPTGGTAQ